MREIKFRAWDSTINKMVSWKDIRKEKWMNLDHQTDMYFMQFTGIKDMNKKEVYEGDIITVHKQHTNYPLNYVVVFNETELGFRMRWTGRLKDKDHNGFYDERISGGDCKVFKIIGNIYENPELLK